MANKIVFLGTGTSQGVPIIGCKCPVCLSSDPHDKRLRTSAYIEYQGLHLLIDAGPDFRQQILTNDISTIDAVLLTHQHKDHTGGLDDARAFNYTTQKGFEIYLEPHVAESIKREYSYAFEKERYPGVPEFILHHIDDKPFTINSVEIIPIRAIHYKLPVLGYRFGPLAYLTDLNYISEESVERLKGIKTLVISCLRKEEHISHFSYDQVIELCGKINPVRVFFTHMSHRMGLHKDMMRELPAHIEPAYDGLSLTF